VFGIEVYLAFEASFRLSDGGRMRLAPAPLRTPANAPAVDGSNLGIPQE
jgi:hypothetical protein